LHRSLHSFPTRRSSDLEMIRLQEKGYLLVIASGRFIHEIEPVAKALQIEEHHGIIIACNGFEIYDKKDNSYHRFTPISAKESEEDRKSTRLNSSHVSIS